MTGRLVALALAASAAAFAAPPAPRQTGAIRGIVVDDVDQPVGGAGVAAYRDGQSALLGASTRTDAAGRFDLPLPAGRYSIGASMGGHVATAFGQMLPWGPPVIVPLEAGQSRELRVVLRRTGVITGTVRDADAALVPGTGVIATRWVARFGRRDLESVARAVTNSRGAFRLFGLAPGAYFVAAEPDRDADVLQTLDGSLLAIQPSYYPASPTVSGARAIEVDAGATVAGIDLAVTATPAGSVTVDVVNPTAFTLATLRGEWQPAGEVAVWGSGQRRDAIQQPDGTLRLVGLPAGRHVVTVRGNVRGARGQPPPLPLFGLVELVASGSADRLSITLQPGSTITGRIVLNGTAAPPDPNITHVGLVPAPDTVDPQANGWIRSETSRAGVTVRGVPPGDYRLQLQPPAPWQVESATADGYDLLDGALPIRPGYDVNTLVVTLTDRRTTLLGTVADAEGAPRYDRLVVVFPADPAKRAVLSRWIATAQPDFDGRFGVRDLPAGEYFVAAGTGDWDPALEPERLSTLEAGARRVTLTPGETVTVDVRTNDR